MNNENFNIGDLVKVENQVNKSYILIFFIKDKVDYFFKVKYIKNTIDFDTKATIWNSCSIKYPYKAIKLSHNSKLAKLLYL